MAKNEAIGGFWTSWLSPAIYKRTQGKRVRQTTAGLIVVWGWFGCWTLSTGPMMDANPNMRVGIPVVLAVVTAWLAYRLVNFPQFADFLIAVEAEMKKISWPSLQQCFRAAAVVIVTMFFLAAVLFLYDQLWIRFFEAIGVLRA
ncbi:MAG TPA: preprotein translocase subunit SecE [Planctomycetaceae bacterium]|nr:preprotein translocase subunit SecE [Planctomycetaceae bacterium]